MGCFFSICPKSYDIFDEQYEMLVASKPAPISLEKIPIDQIEDDAPLFEEALSDNEIISNISDEEFNQYTLKIDSKK